MTARQKILYLAASIIVAGALFAYFWIRPSITKDPNPMQVEVPKGASAHQIARILGGHGVVKSPAYFLILSKISGRSHAFKHGTYLFERNHYGEIIHQLKEGLTLKIRVTIPEGWTSYQIAGKLAVNGILSDPEGFAAQVRQEKAEGMLFPETYFFDLNAASKTVIREMVDEFRKDAPQDLEQGAAQLKMTPLQVLTLASIIEREAQKAEERPLVSSVYHNRLKRRMPLEADPTVQYALSEGKFWKDRILYADLKVNSPYNTYRHTGMPPGPICNPGKKSIEAALHPADTKFLYFVADGQGGHHFLETLREHQQKKIEWKRQKKLKNHH